MTSSCSTALLESALTGDLPAEDETSLYRHLEECELCSAALEHMAGGTAWCQEAALLLTGDELDAAAVPSVYPWSEVDFTVEHLEPADEPNVLGRLGGYDVLEIIGRGGMGVVLKGFDRELKRSVAIKVLAPHLAQSALAKKRFAREAQAAAAVVHPHVLAIHQVQPGGRLPFLVMPLVAGESLAERITAHGTLELKEILRIGMQAAAGLAAAHEQGLVHRDVKPANILLEKGVERAVITDFGLACAADDVTLTRWGIVAGTPQYMSPEQVRGEPLDGRSDLFSLGCVMYEMATGVSPFRADSLMATMRRLVDDAPQAMASFNPELPPWFIAIVDKLLEKDPSRRFTSAKEVSELLEGCLAHVQQPANVPLPAGLPPVKPAAIAWDSTSRHRSARWWGTIVALLLLGLGGSGAFMMATAEPSNIAGEWTGDDWGKVVLKPTAPAEYVGTYTDTVSKEAGEIELKWSRIERRYNGTWSEGKDRFGKISVRQVGDEIRGAWTTNRKSEINPGTPALADLLWVRQKIHAADKASPKNLRFGPEIEQTLNEIAVERNALPRPALNLETNEPLAPPDDIRDFQSAMPWAESHGADIVACSDGGGRGLRIVGGMAIQPANWDAPAKEVAEAISAMELGLEGYKKNISGFQDPRAMGFSNMWVTGDDKPIFYIKTRGGRIGVLQITGTSDGPASKYVRRRSPNWHEVTSHTVAFRYKLLIDDSTWSFGPLIPKQLYTVSSKSPLANDPKNPLRLDNFLRLDDGHLFNLPKKFEEMSVDEREKWLNETRVNFAIDHHGDTDQWEIKLRNVKFAQLPDENWTSLSGKELQEQFPKLKWKEVSNAEAELKQKGFYSLTFTAGMPPPMTFAYETADGQCGIFQFSGYTLAGSFDTAFIRYKQIQQTSDTHKGATDYSVLHTTNQGVETNRSGLEFPAPSDQSTVQTVGESVSGKPLSDAIRQFNNRAERDPIGKDQPPLTDDELRGAIYSLVHAENDRFSTDEKQELDKAAANGELPKDWQLEVFSKIDGVAGERFQGWLIYLSKQRPNSKQGFLVRQQLLYQLDEDGKPEPLPDKTKSNQAVEGATPLAAAINGFNSVHNTVWNVRQKPLTEEEVVAAIRWWKTRRNDAPVTNGEFAQFQKIAETRELYKGSELEVIPDFVESDGTEHFIWSVRIRMPRELEPGWTYAYEIRRQYIGSRDGKAVSEIAWGAADSRGLQAGVRLEPHKGQYVAGEQVTPVFHYRNTGNQAINVAFPRLMTSDYYEKMAVTNANGKEITVEQTSEPPVPVGWLQSSLEPGATHEIRGLPLMLVKVDRNVEPGVAETVIRASAGDSVHLRFELPNPVEKSAPPLPTGEVLILIK